MSCAKKEMEDLFHPDKDWAPAAETYIRVRDRAHKWEYLARVAPMVKSLPNKWAEGIREHPGWKVLEGVQTSPCPCHKDFSPLIEEAESLLTQLMVLYGEAEKRDVPEQLSFMGSPIVADTYAPSFGFSGFTTR